MAEFSYEKKYLYDFESSKYKNVLYIGDDISLLTNNIGYISSSRISVSASYALSSSYALTAGSTNAVNINVFGSNVESYLLFSNVVGTTGVAIGGDADLRYNASTNTLTVGTVSATSLTSSLFGTASYANASLSASFASTASRINTLNQNVTITGSLTVGITSSGPSENTLTLGARDTTSEGGQIGFNAPGGTYTSASFIDVYQDSLRILKGPNAGSTTQLAAVNLQTGNLTLNAGSIIMPTRPAFRVTGATTGAGADKATPTVLSGSLVTVDYNQGSNYNNTNGEFTCPLAGLYHVWYVGRTQNSSLAAVSILKNNTTVLAYWESNTNTGHFGSSAVVSLAANDIVTAKVTAGTITFDTNDNWGVAYIG